MFYFNRRFTCEICYCKFVWSFDLWRKAWEIKLIPHWQRRRTNLVNTRNTVNVPENIPSPGRNQLTDRTIGTVLCIIYQAGDIYWLWGGERAGFQIHRRKPLYINHSTRRQPKHAGQYADIPSRFLYLLYTEQSPVNIKFGQHDIRKFNLHA